MATKKSSEGLRLCANIKSKRVSDQPCRQEAIQGEFCARHSIHPTRYPLYKNSSLQSSQFPPIILQWINKIQKSYRFRNGLRRFRRQGPASTDTSLAHNTTELSTFEPVSSIPLLYRFCIRDSTNHTWLFDLRTLFQIIGQQSTAETQYTNPYTREPISQSILRTLQNRIGFLHKKRYCLLWISSEELFKQQQTQYFHQRVLELSLKFDYLGYPIHSSWIEQLSLESLKNIYIFLSELCQTQIPQETMAQVYPSQEPLFELRLSTMKQRKDMKVLQNALLTVFEKLIGTSLTTEYRVLGALYCLKALAIEVEDMYSKYSWLN
jgi:hypothetical protein